MDDCYSEHEYHPYEDDLMEMSNNEAWADASSDMSEDESNEDNYDDEESDLDNRHLDPSRDDREPGYDDSDYPSNREW